MNEEIKVAEEIVESTVDTVKEIPITVVKSSNTSKAVLGTAGIAILGGIVYLTIKGIKKLQANKEIANTVDEESTIDNEQFVEE